MARNFNPQEISISKLATEAKSTQLTRNTTSRLFKPISKLNQMSRYLQMFSGKFLLGVLNAFYLKHDIYRSG
jgi:hypothetical protein